MNLVEIQVDELPPPAFGEQGEKAEWLEQVKKNIHRALELLGHDNWELSVLFCSNRYIKTLNAEYRGADEATDVLAFPLGERTIEGRFIAGDIVVSLDALKENSYFFDVSCSEELNRLLIHGILHLSGEDHETNSPSEPMLKKQEEVLALLNGV
jgi:probable rRNA maturation factor